MNKLFLILLLFITSVSFGQGNFFWSHTQVENELGPGLELVWNSIANVPVGDASSVSEWNTLFDLPDYGTPFTNVVVSGDTVKLIGATSIEINKDNAEVDLGVFALNENLISVNDRVNCVDSLGSYCFIFCSNLQSVILPNCIILDDFAFGYCSSLNDLQIPFSSYTNFGLQVFSGCTALDGELSFPNQITAGEGCFADCSSLDTLNLPLLESAGNICFDKLTMDSIYLPSLTTSGGGLFLEASITSISIPNIVTVGHGDFNLCLNLTNLSIPSCTNLGGTTGDDAVFYGISGNNITITIKHALESDSDIVYLKANNTVTVIYSD